VVGGKIEIENGGKNHNQVKQNDEAKMFPEKFGLDKRNDQPKRTFDFIQHKKFGICITKMLRNLEKVRVNE
jgi:hypothetical protein